MVESQFHNVTDVEQRRRKKRCCGSDDYREKRKFWEEFAPEYREKYGQQLGEDETSDLEYLIGKPRTLLDAGCGPGRHFGLYEKLGIDEYTGIDFTLPFLEYIEGERRVVLGDMRYLPFKDDSFDVVVCLGSSLKPVRSGDDRAGVLKEFLRVSPAVLIEMKEADEEEVEPLLDGFGKPWKKYEPTTSKKRDTHYYKVWRASKRREGPVRS